MAGDGIDQRLDCDLLAGCDGFHGVSRQAIPDAVLSTYERAYPFGWLGILAETPPPNRELVYANHERGFALATMRSATRSRCYVQVPLDDRVEDWPDERFWDEFCRRSAAGRRRRRAAASFEIDRAAAQLRHRTHAPWLPVPGWGRRPHRSAHGRQGPNLAASDAVMLAEAMAEFFQEGSSAGIDAYSARALARVWKAQRFSWWFTARPTARPMPDHWSGAPGRGDRLHPRLPRCADGAGRDTSVCPSTSASGSLSE